MPMLPLAAALDNQCKNPLYETHWFAKVGSATTEGSPLATVNSIPTVKTGLRYCPYYNVKASCCNVEFESEQLQHYEHFSTMIFPSKLARIEEQRRSVQDVTNTAAFDAATEVQREQLGLALERFNPVLHPSVNAGCFSSLLMYTAGMNCFACRPDWFEFVTRTHSGQVIRVNVDPSVCMELWSQCEVFGEAAMALKQALLDSSLAKQAKLQAEDLNMFADQQALCNWLHDEVATHPFRRPSESEREAARRSSAGQAAMAASQTAQMRRLQAESNTTRRLQGEEFLLDVLTEGRRSGFDIHWHSAMSAGATRAAGVCMWPLLAASATTLASLLANGAYQLR